MSGNIGVCFQINDGGKSGYCPTIHPQLAGEASSQRLYHNYREIILLVMNRYRLLGTADRGRTAGPSLLALDRWRAARPGPVRGP